MRIFFTYLKSCSTMQAILYNIELSAADYMDSHAECGKTFELGLTPATVYGKGAVQTSDSPLSCTIILSTDGIREHRRFSIELVTGFISSQGVNFYIYDGQWTQNSGAQTLVRCFLSSMSNIHTTDCLYSQNNPQNVRSPKSTLGCCMVL